MTADSRASDERGAAFDAFVAGLTVAAAQPA
jgi:hypothetical protein